MEKGVNHAYIKIKYERFGFQIEKETERHRPGQREREWARNEQKDSRKIAA